VAGSGRSWTGIRSAIARIAREGAGGLRALTGNLRPLPDFLVIGAQRGGTTSFYDFLARHPQVRASSVKEVHFFDLRMHKGSRWYRGHFPLDRPVGSGERSWITGEATPYYLFHPEVPRRVRALLPEVRAIALLRDPVERAWSHYRREVRLGRETLSFEEAVACEEERLAAEARRFRDPDVRYAAPHHRYHSYLARGRYAEQLECWLAHLPREQLLILRSEDFYAHPQQALERATAFLGLEIEVPGWTPGSLRHLQAGPEEEPLGEGLREHLRAQFARHNARLYRLLGHDLGWPS